MVDVFASTPPILEAFHAWCDVFCPAFEALRGKDGGDWRLQDELTYPIFMDVLSSIPRGKAVGAGGFSIELLLHADDTVKLAFYRALMADIKSAGRACLSGACRPYGR